MKDLKFVFVFLFSLIVFSVSDMSSSQTLGGVEYCPGGSCTYNTWENGRLVSSCDACCGSNERAACTSLGCTCSLF
jgi:Omega-atracotoxin.